MVLVYVGVVYFVLVYVGVVYFVDVYVGVVYLVLVYVGVVYFVLVCTGVLYVVLVQHGVGVLYVTASTDEGVATDAPTTTKTVANATPATDFERLIM